MQCRWQFHSIHFNGGEASDYTQALALLDGVKADAVLVDKGCDADYVVKAAEFIGAKVVILSKSNRKNPWNFDKDLYDERNLIEGMFNKLKHFWRVATCYDDAASAYFACVMIAPVCLWLKNMSTQFK